METRGRKARLASGIDDGSKEAVRQARGMRRRASAAQCDARARCECRQAPPERRACIGKLEDGAQPAQQFRFLFGEANKALFGSATAAAPLSQRR